MNNNLEMEILALKMAICYYYKHLVNTDVFNGKVYSSNYCHYELSLINQGKELEAKYEKCSRDFEMVEYLKGSLYKMKREANKRKKIYTGCIERLAKNEQFSEDNLNECVEYLTKYYKEKIEIIQEHIPLYEAEFERLEKEKYRLRNELNK